MPTIFGYSKKTIVRNIRTEVHAGRPIKQAVAIALSIARRSFRAKHPRAKFPKGISSR